MPKAERGTPKDVSNRTRSKGMQKLRWFCQMCQKQCRDANGFKCHLMSESHQRQLLLFADNPDPFLAEFSADFERGFMDIVRRQYGTKRVAANHVYNEYIRNKGHVHMNSTRWHSLSGFVQYLGRTGKVKIDQTEKGWFITYVDVEEERKKEKFEKKNKLDRDDEERMTDFILRQAQRAREHEEATKGADVAKAELQRTEGEDKIEFKMASKQPTSEQIEEERRVTEQIRNADSVFKQSASSSVSHDKPRLTTLSHPSRKPRSALEEIKMEEESRAERHNRKEYWLCTDIVVKVVTKRLGDRYYKMKGTVTKMVDDYTAYVEINNDAGDVLKLDQTHLETVIPAVGKRVRIVNGAHRGTLAVLKAINVDKFCVNLVIDEGPRRGIAVKGIAYEDVCKFASK